MCGHFARIVHESPHGISRTCPAFGARGLYLLPALLMSFSGATQGRPAIWSSVARWVETSTS